MNTRTTNQRRAFSLIELLVVTAVIAILAAILLPVLSLAKQKALQSTCLSNQRQLAAALLMYAHENNDAIEGYANGDWTFLGGGYWITPGGQDNFEALIGSQTAAADIAIVRDVLRTNNPLYAYASNVNIYHCPGDPRITLVPQPPDNVGWAYDSYSKTENVAGLVRSPGNSPDGGYWGAPATYTKLTPIQAPSETFIFIEEADCRAFNHGTWVVNWDDAGTLNFWGDAPGLYHGNVSTAAFADGHVESHRWIDGGIIRASLRASHGTPQGSGWGPISGPDYDYIYQHYRFPGWP